MTKISPGVLPNHALCLCSFWLSFPELKSPFQMECSTKCAMLMRCSARMRLEPVVHPASAGKHQRPRYPRKATAPPHAAAIRFLDREPDPPKSGSSSPSVLARMLDPPQSGSSSSAAIQLLPPSGVAAANAERCRLPQRGRTHNKFGMHIARYAMHGHRVAKLILWPLSVARRSGSCSNC